MPGLSGRGHRNARLTLIRLLDQCDFVIAMHEDDDEATAAEPMVSMAQVRRTILEDFGGDPRALQPVSTPSRCEDVADADR